MQRVIKYMGDIYRADSKYQNDEKSCFKFTVPVINNSILR